MVGCRKREREREREREIKQRQRKIGYSHVCIHLLKFCSAMASRCVWFMLTWLTTTISPGRKTFGSNWQSALLTTATKSTSQFITSLHQFCITVSYSHSEAVAHTLTIDRGGGRGVRSHGNRFKQAYMEGLGVGDSVKNLIIEHVHVDFGKAGL